jgi:hypothetical protein
MSAGLYPAFQFFDNAGDPLNGGLVYTYDPGTTTPRTAYQDASLTVAHANPVVLTAFGRPPAPIWLDGETKIVVRTAAASLLDTIDNVNRDLAVGGGWASKAEGVLLKSATYDIAAADDGKTIVATSGSWTLGTASVASTMGDGFLVDFLNAGDGTITFNPNGAETVEGGASINFGFGDGARIFCDGSAWRVLRTRNEALAGFKNRVTNGDLRFDQRNVGAAVTVNTAAAFYGPDMWRGFGESTSVPGVFTMARSTATPPAGFSHYLRATVTTADAAIGASQRYTLATPFEGAQMSDLGFGAVGAATVTISFWVRSSVTGTFSGSVTNGAGNRSHPFTFAISALNTWEYKTVTIVGDVTGTWPADNTAWGTLFFDLGAGISVRAAAGTWAAGSFIGATGATSLIETNGATFDLTGVQLERGSVATAFEWQDIATRWARVQRYYWKSYSQETALGTVTSSGTLGSIATSASVANVAGLHPVRMRAAPTITLYNFVTGAAGTWADGGGTGRALSSSDASDLAWRLAFTTVAVSSTITGQLTMSAEL